MPKAADPTREVALIALASGPVYANDTMREVISYAFEQLTWSWNDAHLAELLAGLASDAGIATALATEMGFEPAKQEA